MSSQLRLPRPQPALQVSDLSQSEHSIQSIDQSATGAGVSGLTNTETRDQEPDCRLQRPGPAALTRTAVLASPSAAIWDIVQSRTTSR